MKNKLSIKLETLRLIIFPLNYEQELKFIDGDNLLEQELGFPLSIRAIPEELLGPIQQRVLPNLKDPSKNSLFYTTWIGIEKSLQKIVGSFGFKGMPNAQKEIEIGYGIFPEFQNRGFMTEMVAAAIEWCRQQNGIDFILAETSNENIPSMKVLLKNNFIEFDRKGTTIWWRRNVMK